MVHETLNHQYDPKDMIFRNLGNTGLKVPVFSLGGWLAVGSAIKGDPCKELMKMAYDNGINCFDTAEVYANGQCEIEMGRVIKEMGWKRSELVIITKIFFGCGSKSPNGRGMDYVDVVFAHRPDFGTPMEETVRGFNHLIEKGQAFYWGTSEWSAAQIEEAHAVAARLNLIPPCAEQPQYSMLSRDRFENEYATLFDNHKYGTTIWSPLASGVLSGKYDDGVPKDSRYATQTQFFGNAEEKFKDPEMVAKVERTRKLKPIADKLGCSRATLALAWAAKNPNVSTVLLGATKPEQLKENLEALKFIDKLTPEVMKEIEQALENKPASANRFGR